MKRLFILLILLVPQFILAQNNPEQLAKSFIKDLNQGKFEQVASQFNEQVATQIDVAQIKKIWETINTQVGSFQEIESVKSDKKGELSITETLCKFEKAYLNIQLAFDKENKVSGLFFKPAVAPDAPKYQLPDYAIESKYETVIMSLESPAGPLKSVYTKPLGLQNPPVIVLVHGSGPNDEDETLGPNKLFVDLATGLASKGIATFRYVKRVKAYPDSFTDNATVQDEVVTDAINAIEKASQLTKGNVYILGHSLGGMMSPMIASQTKKLNGIILFAGNSRPLEQLMIDQVDYILANNAANGQEITYQAIKKAAQKLKNREFSAETSKSELMNISPVYWNDLFRYDQLKAAKKVKVPFLVMQGERDYQVTMRDFEGWKKALGNKATYHSYPALNHMFIKGEGLCFPDEFEKPGNVPEYVIDDIKKWIDTF